MDENTQTTDTQTGTTGKRRTAARLAVAGGVAGLGLAIGGIAIANAGDETPTPPEAAAGAFAPGGDRGFGDRGAFGEEYAAQLAEALGVEQAEVEQALTDVREQLAPDFDRDGERPTEEEREALQDEWTTALAEALGVEQAEVEAAVEDIRAEWEAQAEERFAEFREEFRTSLVEDLDAAVADGTLTEADKESVLKAYDAGIIGGFHGGGPFGGGPFDDDDEAEGSTQQS